MTLKSAFLAGLLLLLSFADGLRADPILGPPVEQNGLRFETWLASPAIAIPNKNIDYKSSIATVLFTVRVTNLTQSPIRFDPFGLYILTLAGPNGKAINADPIMIAGRIRVAQETDYLLLQPGQSLVLPNISRLYWERGRLCLSWSSQAFPEYPEVYEGLVARNYQIKLRYNMPSKTVTIRKEFMGKIIKTLDGFWTGDVTLSSIKFKLIAAN